MEEMLWNTERLKGSAPKSSRKKKRKPVHSSRRGQFLGSPRRTRGKKEVKTIHYAFKETTLGGGEKKQNQVDNGRRSNPEGVSAKQARPEQQPKWKKNSFPKESQ